MKRIICIIMTCALIALSLSVTAADNCKIYVENTTAMSGGTALVTLKTENNTGMAVGKVKLSFDKTKLTPVSADKSDLLTNAYMFTSNLDDPNTDSTELDYITVSWMNMSDIEGDGNLAVIEFAVKENVSGTTNINVEVIELADDIQNNIIPEVADGQITFDNGGSIETPDEDIVLGFSTTTVSKTDNSIGGDVNLSVYLEKPLSAAFICTIFDNNGKLCAVKIKNETLKAGVNEVSVGEIKSTADNETSYAVKVYMWNSIDGMIPLIDEPIVKRY